MQQLDEAEPIRSILERADQLIESKNIVEGYYAVVGETLNVTSEFEGTLLYFPGVRAADLVRRIV